MADRSALDMTILVPESQSRDSAQMTYHLYRSDENKCCKESTTPLVPVGESFSVIYPDAAYIAAPAACQIIANNIGAQEEEKKDNSLAPRISISLSALALVNHFLDQLLFDTLSNSQTLAMPSLRPAIVEVLKPTFAVSAIKRADLELKEYLDGSEDCILSDMQDAIDLVGDVDVNTLWKQTRLRCMLYSSLGEMEDEDGILSGISLVAFESMMISPAVAIFITSVLEFMGEQILAVAGKAAQRRLISKKKNSPLSEKFYTSSTVEDLTVEVSDVECVAFDKLLGELWRAWKENKGLTAIYSSRTRKGSLASIKTLPSLRELQYKESCYPPSNKNFSPSILKNLAHLDLAIGCKTSERSRDQSDIKISKTHIQNETRNSEVTSRKSSKSARPKSCSFIEIEKTYRVSRTKKRRANSIPQLTPPQFSQNFKRLKALSYKQDINCRQVDSILDINEVAPSIASRMIISKKDTWDRISPKENDKKEEKIINLDQMTCISKESPIKTDSTNYVDLDEFKTSKACPSSNLIFPRERTATEHKFKSIENCISSRSSSIDMRGRSLQTMDKFKTPISKNAIVPLRRTSFQDKSSGRQYTLRRPMSMSIPAGKDNDRYFGVEKTIFPLPNSSRNSKTRSESLVASSEFQLDDVENLKQMSENGDLSTKINSKLAVDESEIETDEPASPEIANFAVAVQGVDIYNLDTEFDSGNSGEVKNDFQTTQSDLWFTKPYLNDYVRKRLSDHASDGNVSPISQPNDKPKSNGRISPVSTVSSMEKTPDMDTSRSRQRYFTPSFETPDYQLNLSTPLNSNPVMAQPKYQTHSINSRSSSRSHKVKAAFNSDGNTVGKFEQLIKSDQTIQYTLTPENVRDAEVSDQHQKVKRKNSEQGSILVNKVSLSSSSSSKYVAIDTNLTKPFPTKTNSARTSESNSNPNSLKEVRRRSGVPQPRDARIERDRSLSDFANFIRTTGPNVPTQNKQGILKILSVDNPEKNDSHLERHSSSRNIFHKRFDSASTRIKSSSRDIVTKRSESVSGFIDFVRPAPKFEISLPSISMDQVSYNSPTPSNQSYGASDKKIGNGPHSESRQWRNSPSINSSVTSQSALLINSSQNMSSSIQSRNRFDEKYKMPVRKVRKVRDPYSIDLSDDEEDMGVSSLESKPEQSESLKDFLRNTSPIDLPDNNVVGKTARVNQPTPGLMSLFGLGPNSPQNSSKGLLGSRKIITSRSTYLPSIGSQSSVPRTNFSHKNFEPREATSRVRTDDLAKFLMHNDPPPSMMDKSSSIPLLLTKNLKPNVQTHHKNESGSFQRIFSRRRTSTLTKP